MEYLQMWLLFVAFLSTFGSLQAFFSASTLKTKQFSNAPSQVTPLCRKLFGCWTLVATVVRATCAMHPEEAGLYFVTYCTFIVALLIYVEEAFVAKTIPLPNAIAPFIVASVSLVWMYPAW